MIEETFETWSAADYLQEFYAEEVSPDELHAIRFFVEEQRDARPGPALCFGCGPTLHHVFSIAAHSAEIYLADYLLTNLAEVDKWIRRTPDAHDWRPWARYTLSCEWGREPTEAEVLTRMDSTRERIVELLPADAGLESPLGKAFDRHFPIVLSPFCADSATSDRATWARFSRNIASLVAPNGRLLTSALRQSRQYRAGGRSFPSANIDENDLRAVLEQDFEPNTIRVEVRDVPSHADQGYSAILLARSERGGQ